MGGWTEVETVTYANEPCRINWSSGSERIYFDKNTYFRDGKIYCRVLTVTVENIIQYDGVNYEIVNVSNPDEMDKYMIIEIRLVS